MSHVVVGQRITDASGQDIKAPFCNISHKQAPTGPLVAATRSVAAAVEAGAHAGQAFQLISWNASCPSFCEARTRGMDNFFPFLVVGQTKNAVAGQRWDVRR